MEIQITAIKFETVDGKKTGKSFSFKVDPKKLVAFKTEQKKSGALSKSCLLEAPLRACSKT